jgi:hypothetical protein
MDTISVADWINFFKDVRISNGTEDLERITVSDLDFGFWILWELLDT